MTMKKSLRGESEIVASLSGGRSASGSFASMLSCRVLREATRGPWLYFSKGPSFISAEERRVCLWFLRVSACRHRAALNRWRYEMNMSRRGNITGTFNGVEMSRQRGPNASHGDPTDLIDPSRTVRPHTSTERTPKARSPACSRRSCQSWESGRRLEEPENEADIGLCWSSGALVG